MDDDSNERPDALKTDWAAVYSETYSELVRFLHRKVWDEDRARDLAQEAFTRGLRHSPDNPRAWLFQVAANLARDESRLVIRRKRHLALLQGESETGRRAAPPPSDEVERREELSRVRAALDTLSDRDREVLLLWDAGLDYREIAEQTGLATAAIGTTLARARQRLVHAHSALEGQDEAHS